MSSIKGVPPQGAAPIPQTAPEQANQADRINQSGTRAPAPRQAAEQQAQQGVAEGLLRQTKKPTAADAERLVSQAGYQRTSGRKRDKNFDVGDSTQAPIPLPADDVDPQAWSSSALSEAQERLTKQGHAFLQADQQLEEGADLSALWQRVVEQNYAGSPEALERQAQAGGSVGDEPQADGLMLAQMQQSAQALFGKDLGQTEPGAALVAASLLVAGSAEAVDVLAGPSGSAATLEPKRLAAGVQKVINKGHSAVEDARTMSAGIGAHLLVHRTHISTKR
jgi:hypothetical protein